MASRTRPFFFSLALASGRVPSMHTAVTLYYTLGNIDPNIFKFLEKIPSWHVTLFQVNVDMLYEVENTLQCRLISIQRRINVYYRFCFNKEKQHYCNVVLMLYLKRCWNRVEIMLKLWRWYKFSYETLVPGEATRTYVSVASPGANETSFQRHFSTSFQRWTNVILPAG